jgi:hypothetical protein
VQDAWLTDSAKEVKYAHAHLPGSEVISPGHRAFLASCEKLFYQSKGALYLIQKNERESEASALNKLTAELSFHKYLPQASGSANTNTS